MSKRSLRTMILATAMVGALMATAAPAWADLDGGIGAIRAPAPKLQDKTSSGTSSGETTYTEDNDTNDGGTANNVSDDGDNKHPSGKDRSVESGGSGNQGKAGSHPDDSKGPQRYEGSKGADKPNGSGGKDLADQDGNNGCGNDDDFDDDNNGWCGKPNRTKSSEPSCSKGKKHGWECGQGGGTGGTGSSGSSGCPNKHMGGDDTGNGANQSGAYDSTCDGSPSGNGNGTQGRGKPCAGCVGNADDKNPPGQRPDGSDANKGYECDENSGVGRTNPAHSGCTPAVAGTEVCPEGTDMAGLPAGTTGCATPDVQGRVDLACPADTDKAGEVMANPADCNDSSVLGTILRRAGPVGAAGKRAAGAVGAILPFTGAGDLAAFLVLAGCLIAAGIMMMRRKREIGSEV